MAKFNADALKAQIKSGNTGAGLNVTTEIIKAADEKTIAIIDREKLVPFKNHSFNFRSKADIDDLAESIKTAGILQPLIVRPKDNGIYEILAGHNRCNAAKIAGVNDIPCIIFNCDDDFATIIVNDTNKQRGFNDMLPSEIAKSQLLLKEAKKAHGDSIEDFNAAEADEDNLNELLGEKTAACNKQLSPASIKRYIRLNFLIPELLNKVDEGKLNLVPATIISFFKEEEQEMLLIFVEAGAKISKSKAELLRLLSKENNFTEKEVKNILEPEKKEKEKSFKIIPSDFQGLIPENLNEEDFIIFLEEVLEFYQNNH